MSLLVLDFLGQDADFGLWDLTWALPPASGLADGSGSMKKQLPLVEQLLKFFKKELP